MSAVLMMNVIDIWMDFINNVNKNYVIYNETNLLHINNGQQISHGLPSDQGGLHPPIWSTGCSPRLDADQIQDLNRF